MGLNITDEARANAACWQTKFARMARQSRQTLIMTRSIWVISAVCASVGFVTSNWPLAILGAFWCVWFVRSDAKFRRHLFLCNQAVHHCQRIMADDQGAKDHWNALDPILTELSK